MNVSSPTSVALPAVLMQAQAQAVADELISILKSGVSEGGQAVLDASALTQFDSSALAVILACRRAVMAKRGRLHLHGLPERAQTLAKVYGVNELL